VENKMEIFSFHLKGKMAHFRRFYSNSSALTYTIPPRTTVCGIIAGLMGYERDSYYEDFSLENCDITVALNSPIKKTMQKMNLLMIKGLNDLNGSKENHSQVPTEFLIPQNIRENEIDYQVWIHFKNPELKEKFEALITENRNFYKTNAISCALGLAHNLARFEYEGKYSGTIVDEEKTIAINSAVSVKNIIEIDQETDQLSLIVEELPLEFDSQRALTENGKKRILFSRTGVPVKLRIREHVQLDNGEKICWMK